MAESWLAFERYAQRYDAWFEGPAGSALFPAEAAALGLLIQLLPQPLLEVGAGPGRFSLALGASVALDPARGALAIARERGEIQAVQGVGEFLPFAADMFGGVLLTSSLCFVSSPKEVFREAWRVLRPGGGLVIGEIEKNSAWGKLYRRMGAAGHVFYGGAHFYTLGETLAALRRADFALEACASTLLEPPSETPEPEEAYLGIHPRASFIAILARKAGAPLNT